MNAFTGFMVFCIVWWLIWFILLPVGIERDDNPNPMHSAGAPKNIRLKKKFILTTALSVVTTLVIVYLVTHYSLF